MRVEIKFCGLTRSEDANHAVSLGASYVGVIFAGGPRMLTVDRARDVLAGVPETVRRVGVFADQTATEIARVAERLGLAVVQLHGTAGIERIAEVGREFSGHIWPVLRVVDGELTPEFPELADVADGVLLDAYSPNALGGTGVRLPWRMLSAELTRRRGETPIILAGGLSADNVAQAIGDLEPDVVDVSSGVERSPGIKDHDRMRAFRDAVTHASISTSRSTSRSPSR
ncbi:MAG: phosphoribosylanthranilate isomerase [bacterium]